VRPQTRYALSGDISIAYQVLGAGLVAGSGITFAERGEHALKGLPDRLRLFAVEST
jgi:hypothetical protein